MKIVKKFNDGTVLVSSEEGSAIMRIEEYERIKVQKLDIGNEILKRLKNYFPHCNFSIHEIKSREHIFMDDDIELTNLSIGSIEFWMRDQRMTYDDIMSYLDSKIMPPIFMETNKVEHQRCKDDMMYFFKHYARIHETKV